jgi:hypothetical protein
VSVVEVDGGYREALVAGVTGEQACPDCGVFSAGAFGVPRRSRTPDPIESGPEWRMENARTAQEVYA